MGCGRMSPALLLLLFLASCSLLQGMLLRPRHVRLEAENFHVRLHWEPDPSSPSNATYEVEWRNRTLNWTKAGACRGNSRGSWVCELYFDRIHDIYWARVRVVAGGQQSEWASSSELQLYRDTIVGPPRLSWLLQDQILSINIITPLTPYKRRTGSYKPVDRVLLKLWYWLQLFEGDLLIQQVPCKQSSEEVPCTFGKLKPSTQYCVRTVAAGIARQRSREVEQCLVTPAGPAGFPWVPAMLGASFLLLLLSVAGLCFMQLHVFPSPPETRLPKALALQNSELSVPPLQLEENPLALLLQTVLPSHGPSTAGQASTVVPQLLRGLNQDVSGYCDNGFGPDCPEGRDPSCTQRLQLGHALGSQVPSQPEKDGEAGDGDDLPEQLVLVGLTGSSYIGDRDSQIPERWLPLHFQLYSKCQCPVLGAGSHLPLPVPSRSCSQEYLEQSLGTAEHWIRLSSVKLPSSAEEEGEQLPCAPQPLLGGGPGPQQGDSGVSPGCSAQAAPRVPSPCRPLPSPRSFLRAVAFSGYEPRAPSGSEP
ncbi:interleukin-22 receptor subunit alpha-1-like isoform X2 [Sylvia atricapilla]|uniref:interleukin-22 receptor subunit alpha-1-like isoform X2 n=1 Tax=Sylvia atricapilla TaxID=48155 RepID=UPI00339A4E24